MSHSQPSVVSLFGDISHGHFIVYSLEIVIMHTLGPLQDSGIFICEIFITMLMSCPLVYPFVHFKFRLVEQVSHGAPIVIRITDLWGCVLQKIFRAVQRISNVNFRFFLTPLRLIIIYGVFPIAFHADSLRVLILSYPLFHLFLVSPYDNVRLVYFIDEWDFQYVCV